MIYRVLKYLKKDNYALLFLLVLSTAVYKAWLIPGIFVSGDLMYSFPKQLIDSSHIYLWDSFYQFGRLPFAPFKAPIDMMSAMLGNFDLATKLLYFFPVIFLLPIISFYFVKYFTKTSTSAFVGSVVIMFNTYFLSINSVGHIAIETAVTFSLFSMLFYIKKYKVGNLSLSALFLGLSGFYDFRVAYIFIGLFFLWSIVVSLSNHTYHTYFIEIKKIIHLLCLFILLNAFWILGVSVSGFGGEVLSRNLFGDQYWSLLHAITLHYPFWTYVNLDWFMLHNIPVVFFIIPLVTFLGYAMSPKKYKVFFWAFVVLIGLFLTKQSDAPFPNVYTWLYNYVPGFNAFREASKFYILIILSYSIFIAFFVNIVFRSKLQKKIKLIGIILVAIIFISFLCNGKSIFTGEIGGLYIKKQVPDDYIVFYKTFSNNDGSQRVLWVPRASVWSFYSNANQRVNIFNSLHTDWKNLFVTNNLNAQKKIKQIQKSKCADSLFDVSNIRYVVVPIIDTYNNFNLFQYYGGKENSNIRQWYIDQLDKLDYLKKIDIGTKELVVYENKDYKPYIRGIDNLLGFEETKNLEDKYSFINDALHRDFDFSVLNEKKDIPMEKVDMLFENLNSSYFKNGVIESWLPKEQKENLYLNKGKKELVLNVVGDELVLKNIFQEHLLVDGQKVFKESVLNNNKILYTTKVEDNKKYYLKNGESIVSVENNIALNENLPVEIYESNGDNVIKNGSFENGLWNDKIGDCNNYDDNPVLGMDRVVKSQKFTPSDDSGSKVESKDGDKYALELQATRHIACTKQDDISVQGGQKYLLSFDYQSDNAQQGGFYLSYDNENAKDVISEKLPISDEQWRKYSRVITVPDDADKISLYVYAYETDGEKNNIVRYDNFKLQKLELLKEIVPEKNDNFVKVDLLESDADKYHFEYRDDRYDYHNLIVNGSLEDGLWRKKVSDCNNYDDNPILGMDRVVKSQMPNVESRDDDKYALELQATRHIACTGPNVIPVKGGVDYLLEFDYQSDNGKRAGYNIGFNDEARTNINEKINIKKDDKGWHTFSKKITVPAGATTAHLTVYSYAKDKKTNIITRYDNFKFIELPDLNNRYYSVSKPSVELARPRSVEFDLINPTKKLVHIKGATKPFYLTMSESYHDKWQAQLNNSKVHGFFKSWVPFVHPDAISNEQHFKYMTFLNGWYINPQDLCESKVDSKNPPQSPFAKREVQEGCTKNPDGSYDIEMVIEFTPQRYFYLGLLISGTTFISLVGYLIYDFIKRRRKPPTGVQHL